MPATCSRHGAAALSYGSCRSLRWLALFSVIAIVPMAAPAIAQDTYPNRPVKIIAPQAPGGGVDLVARIITDKLRLALGQPFLVENQAGAGVAIGTTLAQGPRLQPCADCAPHRR